MEFHKGMPLHPPPPPQVEIPLGNDLPPAEAPTALGIQSLRLAEAPTAKTFPFPWMAVNPSPSPG